MKNFDQHIKNSLENFEAQYNPADWTDMQNRLNKAKAGKSSNIGKALLIAASLLVTAGVVYYFTSTGEVKPVTAENSTGKSENVVPENMDVNKAENPVAKDNSGANVPVVKNDDRNNAPAVDRSAVKNDKSQNPETVTPLNKTENSTNTKEPVPNPVQPLPVETNPVLSAGFRPEATRMCEDAEIQFVPERVDANLGYKWYFGDGESSSEPTPKHTYADAGTYSVKLTIVSKDKKQTDQKMMKVIVNAVPSVHIDMNPSDDNVLTVLFEGDTDKITEWKWDFDDKGTSASQNPTHTFKKYGTYNVSLTAKNAGGCVAVVKEELNLQLNLQAGTKFTPYKDDHNTFMPQALRDGEYQFTFTVSDRFGKEVFKTSDKDSPWDGKVNGKLASIGDTFRWTAVVKGKNGEEIPCTGVVTVAKE